MARFTYIAPTTPVVLELPDGLFPIHANELTIVTSRRRPPRVIGLGYEDGLATRPVHFDVGLDAITSEHRAEIESTLESR